MHVLAPDDSKWIERDDTLPIPPGARVVRARNLSPATRLLGAELYRARRRLAPLAARLIDYCTFGAHEPARHVSVAQHGFAASHFSSVSRA